MTINPFEDEAASFKVLVNPEMQYSLWPTRVAVPDGWQIAHDDDSRQACLTFIEDNWKDMRPRSLAEFLEVPKAS